MSNLQIIQELCKICDMQIAVIRGQAAALSQLGAMAMENERIEAEEAYSRLLGSDELPDEMEARK